MERRITLVKIGEITPPTVSMKRNETMDARMAAFLLQCRMDMFYARDADDKKVVDFNVFKSGLRGYTGAVAYYA
jgi:hypothetical protein